MIDKTKKYLVWQYTCIIFAISALLFVGCDSIYHYVITHNLEENLADYLNEEYREALDYNLNFHEEIHSSAADATMIQTFSYWILDSKIIHADQPEGTIGKELLDKVLRLDIADRELTRFKLKNQKEIWKFAALATSFTLKGQQGKIVVLMNMTPIEKFTHTYKKIGFIVLFVICLLSYFIALSLANRAIAPIVKMYHRQKDFVSNASHELKTPLGVLMAYSELIETKYGSNAEIDVIKDEVKNMSGLIDDLLYLSKLDSLKTNVKRPPLDILSCLKETIKKFNALANDRKFPITLKTDKQNLTVSLSLGDLERILNVLIENALKYTPKDKHISLEADTDDKKVYIRVIDEGIGIEQKDIAHIFEKFYRADESHNRNISGYGLGLSIAKEIIEQNRGSISVISHPGKGSVFTVEFPAAK